jgi:hypothetical protein
MLNRSFGNAIAARKSDNNQGGSRAIGQLNGTRKFRGTVGLGDKIDFYSFTLSGRSSFNLSLNKLKNNVDVFLQQGKQVVARSTKGGKKSESISTTLEAGTYFVRVQQKSGNSKYQLTLNATPNPGAGTNPPGSRRLVVMGLQPTVPLPKYGLIDLSTGVVSDLPLNNPFDQGSLTDVAVFGNDIYSNGLLSNLYKYDSTTGISTLVGDLGGFADRTNFISLGFGANGILYSVGTNARTRETGLYTVDLASGGKANLVANIPGIVDVGDIAYDAASSRFFASASSTGTGNSVLYSIGLTGEARLIGDIGFSNVGALLYENGILYGFDSALSGSQKQLVIDTNTWAGRIDKMVTRNNESWGYITGGG